MAFTSTDLAAVDSAIASGELTVEVNGKRVTYRSFSELEQARRLIMADIAGTAGTSSTRRGSYRVNFTTLRGD